MPKMNRRLSLSTTFRSRTPTNEQTASNFTNMVFDHSRQKALMPDRWPKRLVEATVLNSISNRRPMNASGKPMALGITDTGGIRIGGDRIEVGGSPDSPGTRKL